MIRHPRQLCSVCKTLQHCGIMVVRDADGKGVSNQRVCGECWDETIVKKGSGVARGHGGRRVIRGTNSLT